MPTSLFFEIVNSKIILLYLLVLACFKVGDNGDLVESECKKQENVKTHSVIVKCPKILHPGWIQASQLGHNIFTSLLSLLTFTLPPPSGRLYFTHFYIPLREA